MTEEIVFEGYVGTKGEIYVKKKFRELLDLRPGDIIEFVVKGKVVTLKKRPSARELLKSKKAKVSLEELMELRKEFEKELKK